MKFNNELMIDGYRFLQEGDVVKACDCWLQIWDDVKKYGQENDIKDVEDIDDETESFESLVNWVQDIEMELENAGIVDKKYYHIRIDYCREFCNIFPKSDEFIIMNMKTAVAETHYEIGEEEKSDRLFEEVIDEFKITVWPYIKWGDTKWLSAAKMEGITLADLKMAEEIYVRAESIEDEDDYHLLEDRLKEVRSYIEQAQSK